MLSFLLFRVILLRVNLVADRSSVLQGHGSTGLQLTPRLVAFARMVSRTSVSGLSIQIPNKWKNRRRTGMPNVLLFIVKRFFVVRVM